MADSDKNILITPNQGSTDDPKIEFTGADPNTITLSVLDDATLSFSGASGQLFSISDSLTGTIFSVNDISGIPSIEVDDDGTLRFAEFAGNVLVGTDVDNGNKLQVEGIITAATPGLLRNDNSVATTEFVKSQGYVTSTSFVEGIDVGTAEKGGSFSIPISGVNVRPTFDIGAYEASGDSYWRWRFRADVDEVSAYRDVMTLTPASSTTANLSVSGTISASGYNNSNWDTAYGWGNHASAGYLTSVPSEYLTQTEGDARYQQSNGLHKRIYKNNGSTGTVWYKLGNFGNTSGFVQIVGTIGSHVESFGTSRLDLTIYAREGNNAASISIDGKFEVAHQGTGVQVYRKDNDGGYESYDVWLKVGNYAQVCIDLNYIGLTYDGTSTTTQPDTSVYFDTEIDTTTYGQGSYDVEASAVYERYNTGNLTNNSTNWDTAYGWGDHSTQGYLTSFDITTQTDSKYLRSDADDTTTGNITFSGTDWYLMSLGARGASVGAYGIGNRSNDAYRQLTFHVPNVAAYSSTGTVPSFGWYSNGSVELMNLKSDSGDLTIKGVFQIGDTTVIDGSRNLVNIANIDYTGSVTNSDTRHEWRRSYLLNNTTPKELLYKDGNSLPNGGVYRFSAHISGTGTDNWATAVYWNQNGTWKLNVTQQSGTSSNNPEFIISGDKPTLHIDHSSNYTVHVFSERLELSEGAGTDNNAGFGADAFMGSVGQTLRYNPNGGASNYAYGWNVFHDAYHPNADKWTTASTLSLTGDVTGSVSWDGSANASITATVANDSHTHDGRYYTESEADSRFANITGDTFTGNLNVDGGYLQSYGLFYLRDDLNFINSEANGWHTIIEKNGGNPYFNAIDSYRVGNTTVIDSSRNGFFANTTHTGNMYWNGHIYWGASKNIYIQSGECSFDVSTSAQWRVWDATNSIDAIKVTGGSQVEIGQAGTRGLKVFGSITATGNVTAYSDRRLKDNIKTLDGSKVYEMRGVSFTKDGELGSGVIAQELEKVAPELVLTSQDEMQTKSVAYGNVVGYLIEAIKELKQEIEVLKNGNNTN